MMMALLRPSAGARIVGRLAPAASLAPACLAPLRRGSSYDHHENVAAWPTDGLATNGTTGGEPETAAPVGPPRTPAGDGETPDDDDDDLARIKEAFLEQIVPAEETFRHRVAEATSDFVEHVVARAAARATILRLADVARDGPKEASEAAEWALGELARNAAAARIAKDGTDGAHDAAEALRTRRLVDNVSERVVATAVARASRAARDVAESRTSGAKEAVAMALEEKDRAPPRPNTRSFTKVSAAAVLVQVAKNGTDRAKEAAAQTLGELLSAGRDGAVADMLAEIAKNGPDRAKEAAARSICHLLDDGADDDVSIRGDVSYDVACSLFKPLFRLAGHGTDESKLAATRALCKLSRIDWDFTLNLDAGAIPPLVDVVENGTDVEKEAAARILSFVAEKADDHAVSIAAAGAIPPLVELAKHGTDSAKTRAVWTLGTLAKNADNAVSIAAAGAIPPLVDVLKSISDYEQEGVVLGVVLAIHHLSLNADNKVLIASAGAIPPLVQLAWDGWEDAQEVLESLAENADNRLSIAAAEALLAKNGTTM